MWRYGSVRGKSMKFHKQILNRNRIHSRQISISRMNHHRRVDSRERTFSRHFDFPAAAFFSWRTHQNQIATTLFGDCA